MEQYKRKCPKPSDYRNFQMKTFNKNRMSINKGKAPANQLNSSTNANLKDQSRGKVATDPVPDDSVLHSQEKQERDPLNMGDEGDKDKGTESHEEDRHHPSKKESLGDGNTESGNVEEDDRQDDGLNSVKKNNEPGVTNWDAISEDLDNNLPSNIALLTTPGGSKVYVVGTVHYSVKSQEDVARLIRAVQPNYLVLELCKARSIMLHWDEETVFEHAQNISISEALRRSFQLGFLEGLFFVTLFVLSVRMTKALGVAPGGEFRIAYKETEDIPGCVIVYADIPITLTLKKLFSKLSYWQVIKIVVFLMFKSKTMSQEEVEKYRNMDEVEKMLLQFAREAPDVAKVLVNERDAVMTYFMQLAAHTGEPNVVVSVVGLGHLMGIKENWGKVSIEQMDEIMTLPPPPRHHKIIRYSIKLTAAGLVLYGVHKIVSKTSFYQNFFRTIFSTSN